jgi:Integrase core domain
MIHVISQVNEHMSVFFCQGLLGAQAQEPGQFVRIILNMLPSVLPVKMYVRTTCYDRVPIKAVPRDAVVFRHFQMDVIGRILPSERLKHNFALIVICSATRYPFVFPLTKVNSENVCDAFLKMFEITGIASEMAITRDNASYFRSTLMHEFMHRLGITPRFSTPYHSEGHSLARKGEIKPFRTPLPNWLVNIEIAGHRTYRSSSVGCTRSA